MQSSSAQVARQARLIARAAVKGALATNRRAAQSSRQSQPYVSKVGVATDQAGAPLFLFSTLAAHTQDLLADSRASLLVEAPTTTENPLEGARCTLVGRVEKLAGPEAEAARAIYLVRHPSAARYAGFGDFALWRMHIEKVHHVGGFGRAKWVKGTDFPSVAAGLLEAQGRILESFNGPRRDDLCGVVAHVTGRSGRSAKLIGIDADGLIVAGTKGAQTRIDFLSPARDVRGWRARFQGLLKQSRG